MMKKTRKTKIIATLGPSCSSPKTIEEMMLSGVDVFRINFSHANHPEIEKVISTIRSLNKKNNVYTSILADLQGPKLRIGNVEEGINIVRDEIVKFSSEKKFIGNNKRVYVKYKRFAKDVKIGETLLIDDGKLIFKILETDNVYNVKARVIQGGHLSSKKGINLPNSKISLPALTEKDLEDAIFSINQKVDWIALSFVRNGSDLNELKKIITEKSNHKIPIISKIEKPEALDNIDEIILNSDGIMVARGDLGVEVSAAKVPLIQKQLVNKAKKSRIPVIIATQMMEGMINSLTPTRAEVNDVANSVMDGADAVMLSGETSVGKYPVKVVDAMSSILKTVEDSPLIKVPQSPPSVRSKRYITKSICYHAANMANEIDATAICTLTNSGYTAFQISAWRPSANILVFTSNELILTQLNLLWGVKAFYYDKFESTDKTVVQVNNMALKNNFVEKGDMLINLAAMPVKKKGMVNTLRISMI